MFNKILRKQKETLEQQIAKYKESIQQQEKQLSNIESQIEQKKWELKRIQSEVIESEYKLNNYQREIGTAEGIITMQDLGLAYDPVLNAMDDILVEKNRIQSEIGRLIGSDKAIVTTRVYRIDNSEYKGRQFQKAFCENLMVGFNTYFEKKKKSVTEANFYKTKELIEKKFATINKKAALMGVSIHDQYLKLCLELLSVELDGKIAKAEEKERLREERRRLKEQEQLLAEAEKERKELEVERRNLQKLFAQAISEQEQEEIKNKLAEVDKRSEEIDWRLTHQSAGWLYIATTPCLQGMYKAGCTKQLNPLNRIAQLSSASVPYPFECRCLVFSENVFELETQLHHHLDDVRVNKVNRGKEFFYGEPDDAIKILKNEFKVDVHFIDESWVKEKEENE